MSEVIDKSKSKKKTRSDKFEKLVGPTDPKVDHDARERLVTARIGLLLRHSFFGNLATRLTLITPMTGVQLRQLTVSNSITIAASL
jgi:hypothetical protein